MKKNNVSLVTFAIITLVSTKVSLAAQAFPGAEGFGSDTRGAYELYDRTGNASDLPSIIHVTNTNDSGAGSLRTALAASGPRIIVFDTGGIINATSGHMIINDPYCTVAGQTAPGDGIVMRGWPLLIKDTHDVIIRGMRSRPTTTFGISRSQVDAFQIEGTWDGAKIENIILDHCSGSWSGDEMLSTWRGVKNITISNNLFYKPSDADGHPYGVMIGPESEYVSYHHNILMHSSYRNPLIGGTTSQTSYDDAPTNIEVINNVSYNGRYYGAIDMFSDNGDGGGSSLQYIAIRHEFHKNGPDAEVQDDYRFMGRSDSQASGDDWVHDDSRIFLEGNLTQRRKLQTDDQWLVCKSSNCNFAARYDNWPFTASGITETEAYANFQYLMGMDGDIPRVGAYPRDIVDTIAIEELAPEVGGDKLRGDGGAMGPGPNTQSTTSDWRNNRSRFPAYSSGATPTDTDQDGMPDSWENAKGSNPTNPSDAHGDSDNDGYTNIEEYINSFFLLEDESVQLQKPADFKLVL